MAHTVAVAVFGGVVPSGCQRRLFAAARERPRGSSRLAVLSDNPSGNEEGSHDDAASEDEARFPVTDITCSNCRSSFAEVSDIVSSNRNQIEAKQ